MKEQTPDLIEMGVGHREERVYQPPSIPAGRVGQRTREGWEPRRTPPELVRQAREMRMGRGK